MSTNPRVAQNASVLARETRGGTLGGIFVDTGGGAPEEEEQFLQVNDLNKKSK